MTHTYSDDYTHNYVTTFPFRPIDVVSGVRAMTGNSESLEMIVKSWPTEKWDSVRAFIRRARMVETIGQLTHLTRAGKRYLRAVRDGSLQ
jgi:hypothetical protein